MDAALEACRADYLVAKDVCETLAELQPSSEDHKTCVLDMLVTAAHSPHGTEEQRRTLYRLADLFHVSWTRTWEDLDRGRRTSDDNVYEMRCYVPPRCPMIWEGMLSQAELNARLCGAAATLVRGVQASVPLRASLERTRDWIDVAQSFLSVTGQMLRREQPPLREVGPRDENSQGRMAAVEPAPDTVHPCKACGYTYPVSEGRVHGRHFLCRACLNVQNTIRRNLGDTSDVSSFSAEDSLAFYRGLRDQQKKDDGQMTWKTIRAGMLNRLTEEHMTKFSSTVAVEELPLSVYTTRGWPEEVIKKFPSEMSTDYGCEVYKVPVRTMTWQEAFQKVESRILEKERVATQKKGKKQEDLDLPSADKGGDTGNDAASSAKAARTAAAAAKKVVLQNARIASSAAKALGSLTSAENALQKCIAKAENVEERDAAAMDLCKESLAKAKDWRGAACEAVNRQDVLRASGDEKPEALAALPFNGDDLKLFLKTMTEAQKALKESLPKKAPKAKTAPKRKASEAADGEKPTRLRGKTAPKSS
eukprot:s59_g74.t1